MTDLLISGSGSSSFFGIFLLFLIIFQSSRVSSAYSTLKNGKNLVKNKEKLVQKLKEETSITDAGEFGHKMRKIGEKCL